MTFTMAISRHETYGGGNLKRSKLQKETETFLEKTD